MGRRTTSLVQFHAQREPGLSAAQGRNVDARFVRHAHESYVFGLTGQGGRRLILDTEVVDLPPGSLFACNPGEPHACTPLIGRCQDYVVLGVGQRLATELLGLISDSPLPVLPSALPKSADLRLALEQILTLFQTNQPLNEIRFALKRFLDLLQVNIPGLTLTSSAPALHPAVAQALAIIQAEYALPLTLETLSCRVCFSPGHLQRLFREQIGLSPWEKLQSERVRRAAGLLGQGVSPTIAALDVGFCDQSHLSRVFRRIMGTTPGHYAASNGPA